MEAPQKENQTVTKTKNPYIVGTKTGQCQICKETKKLLLLRYGFSLCEDCLSVCIGILEHLQFGVIEKTPSISPNKKARPKTSRKPPVSKQAATKNAQASNPKN
jgi:hypothetical protein